MLRKLPSDFRNSYQPLNRLQPHPYLLSPLDKSHRRRIDPPPMQHINRSRQPNHAHPHHRRPIGRARRHGHGVRKAAEHNHESGIQERERVDWQTPLAKAPSGGRQFLFPDALEQDAADGDHVCGEEGEQSEGDDEVKGGGGAEVDEADDAGGDGGEVDGVFGDVAGVV